MIIYFIIEDLLKHYLQKKFHTLDLFNRILANVIHVHFHHYSLNYIHHQQ